MFADRLLDWCLARLEADFCLEPLPIRRDQADQCNGRTAKPRGKADDVVETNLGSGVENTLCMQRIETIGLVHDITCVCNCLIARQLTYPCNRELNPALTDMTAVVSRACQAP